MMLKASESGIISQAELTGLRTEMGEDQYQQEFECSFEAAIKGAFYAVSCRRIRLGRRRLGMDLEAHQDCPPHKGGSSIH